jgi:hypothetical protein
MQTGSYFYDILSLNEILSELLAYLKPQDIGKITVCFLCSSLNKKIMNKHLHSSLHEEEWFWKSLYAAKFHVCCNFRTRLNFRFYPAKCLTGQLSQSTSCVHAIHPWVSVGQRPEQKIYLWSQTKRLLNFSTSRL